MKVLYINLDKDIKRRDFMEKQLKHLCFEYERVPAVDGRALTEDEIREVYDSETSIKYNKKDLTRGEIGCALSHKLCHEKALGNDYTLILEDDIELPENFKEIVEGQIEKNIKYKKWDYLQFDYPEVGVVFIKRWMESFKPSLVLHKNKSLFVVTLFIKGLYILPISFIEGARNIFTYKLKKGYSGIFMRPLYHAGAYVITSETAKILLGSEVKIIFSADRLQNQKRKEKDFTHRAYIPRILKQKRSLFGSSIQNIKYTKND